jgi:hypothetical protein
MTSMKRVTVVILAMTLAIAARGDLTITQQIQKEGPPQGGNVTMTMKIKEGKMRLDLNPQVSSIVDLKTGDMISLLHQQKLVMTIPGGLIKSLQGAHAQEAAKSVGANPIPPKPTGRKETISGYVCEEFETIANDMIVHLWLTKDLPNSEKLMSELSTLAGANPFRGLTKDQQLPGFPIRTVVDAKRLGKTTLTVVTVSESPIADSEFMVPDGYRTMQTPALLNK